VPKLYIANATKQNFDFIFWVSEVPQPRRQKIPAGGQIMVYQDNMTLEQINSIVKQHERYGLTRVSEIDRRKPFVGLCYDIDRPVKIEKILYADEHNAGVLQDVSMEARKLSAGALHDAILRATDRSPLTLQGLDMEVIEQNGPTESGLNEVVSVNRDNSAPPRAPRSRLRR
jgi:hypothetical protein